MIFRRRILLCAANAPSVVELQKRLTPLLGAEPSAADTSRLISALSSKPAHLDSFVSVLPPAPSSLPTASVSSLFDSLDANHALQSLAWLSSITYPPLSSDALHTTVQRLMAACDSLPAPPASFFTHATALLDTAMPLLPHETSRCLTAVLALRDRHKVGEKGLSDYFALSLWASAADASAARAHLARRAAAGLEIGLHHRAAVLEAETRSAGARLGLSELRRAGEELQRWCRGYAVKAVFDVAKMDGDEGAMAELREMARQHGVQCEVGEAGDAIGDQSPSIDGEEVAAAWERAMEEHDETDEELLERWEKSFPGLHEKAMSAAELCQYIMKFEKREAGPEALDEMFRFV